ncbi:MAG: outer membrane lipoprotein carrier protein LolA [Bacteroidales bacterium]|nr:outer membrane lipoprotein carrier protein LolA [Bacteroidales bacterium]
MKKFLLSTLVVLAAGLTAAAQQPFRDFARAVSASCVTFDYAFESLRDGVKFTGNGSAAVQGEAFRMDGNGLAILSDGETRWTADDESKELIIEPVDGTATDFISNPALLVSAAEKSFDLKSTGKATFKGKSMTSCVLQPRTASGIRELALYFSGESLEGVRVTLEDGTVTDFEISGLKFSAPGPLDGFRFKKEIGKDWIVTDLR